MPIFEGRCEKKDCSNHGQLYEYLLKSWDNPDPDCPVCNRQLGRQFSAPNAIWVKGIGQYCRENTEGHFAYARNPENNQEVTKQFITTRKQQKDFCKRFGYYDPADLPNAPTANREGKAANTSGEPGQWI